MKRICIGLGVTLKKSMPLLTNQDFIEKLEREAADQRRLLEHQILPNRLKGVGRWVILYPWQTLLISSLLTTLLLKLIGLF